MEDYTRYIQFIRGKQLWKGKITNAWEALCFKNTNKSKVNNEKRKIPVVAIKENTCMHFKSISEAERYFDSRHIVDVLKGRREHVKGFSFVYESEVM